MGFGIKTKLLKFINIEIISRFGPQMIRISPVGYACTNACPMCWRIMKKITDKSKLRSSELKYQKYKEILTTLPFTVSKVEMVGGGEPLLFPKVSNLFYEIKRKNLFGLLITNGVLLNKKISNLLVEVGWNTVRVSINAGSKRVYAIVNGANYFDQVVANVRYLAQNRNNKKPKIGLHFVLQKTNYLDINNFLKLAQDLEVDFVSFDTLIHNSKKSLLLSDKETAEVIHNLKIRQHDFLLSNNIKELLFKLKINSSKKSKAYFANRYCQVVQDSIDIDSEGNVVPCCMAYGESISKNLSGSSLSKIWKKNYSFRRQLKKGQFADFCYEKCNYSLNRRIAKSSSKSGNKISLVC